MGRNLFSVFSPDTTMPSMGDSEKVSASQELLPF